MPKSIKIILLFVFMATLFVGCGSEDSKENDQNNNNNNNVVNDKTKVNNLSESFSKFSEIKSEKMDALNDLSDKTDNYVFTMALLPIALSDLTIIPASICGMEESIAVQSLFLFENVTYKMEGNKCTVTYSGAEGNTNKFVANYDPNTDSATMDSYENNVITMTSEYVKIKDGYGTQFFMKNDEDDKFSVYKTLFENDNIYTSIDQNVDKPQSIFKNNAITKEFAKNGQYLYISIEDGFSKAILEGEEVDFNTKTE